MSQSPCIAGELLPLLEGILTVIINPNLTTPQDILQKSEKALFDLWRNNPNQMVEALFQIGIMSNSEEHRTFSLITLRRLMFSKRKKLFDILSPAVQFLRRNLIPAIERENSKKILGHLTELIVFIADSLFKAKEKWVELIPWVLQLCSCDSISHVQYGYVILGGLVPQLTDEVQSDEGRKILIQTLKNGIEASVIEIGQSALSSLLPFLPHHPGYRQEFQILIQPILNLLSKSVQSNQQRHSSDTLKVLIDLIAVDHEFLKPALIVVSQAMVSITQNSEFNSSKNLAIEFLVDYIEKDLETFQKIDGFSAAFIQLLLQLMLKIPEIELKEWNLIAEEDDEILQGVTETAQVSLERACKVMGNHLLTVLFNQLPSFLSNKDWKHRYVGLIAITFVSKLLDSKMIPQVLQIVEQKFSDTHPRVRWASIHFIHQLLQLPSPIATKYHKNILPSLITSTQDFQNSKVQTQALSTIATFCEKFTKKLIAPYLSNMLSAFFQLLKSSSVSVQQEAITTIAAISGCAKELFQPYYSNFSPLLMHIVTEATSKDLQLFRSRSIECISIVGWSVGKELFRTDALRLVEILKGIPISTDEFSDPMRQVVLQAWVRISICLEDEFLPYLEILMQSLFKTASMDIELIFSEDADEENNISQKAIKTQVLEEKSTICNHIFYFASSLSQNFLPYIRPTAELMVPLLSYPHHEGVRLACLSTMPHLLNISKARYWNTKTPSDLSLLGWCFDFAFPSMLKAVANEEELDVAVVGLSLISECIAVMNTDFPQTFIHQVVVLVRNFLTKTSFQRHKIHNRANQFDVEEVDILCEEIEPLDFVLLELNAIIDFFTCVVGSLIEANCEAFLKSFIDLAPSLLEMTHSNSAITEKKFSINVFTKLFSTLKTLSFDFQIGSPLTNKPSTIDLGEHFILFLSDNLNPDAFNQKGLSNSCSEILDVTQSSIEGLGICCQFGAQKFAPLVRKVVDKIVHLLTTTQHQNIKDSIINLIGKIIDYQSEPIGEPIHELSVFWLNHLPIRNEGNDAIEAHATLLKFLETQKFCIVGPDGQNSPKIISLICSILENDQLFSELSLKRFSDYLCLLPHDFIQTIPEHYRAKIISVVTGLAM